MRVSTSVAMPCEECAHKLFHMYTEICIITEGDTLIWRVFELEAHKSMPFIITP